jgi:hypothetical protein
VSSTGVRRQRADHQQTTALFHPGLDEFQPVRHGLRMQPDSGRKQQRIRTDVRQDDGVIGIEAGHVEGKFFHRFMGGHIGQVVFAAFQCLDQRLCPEVEGNAAELVEAFVMSGGTDPAFADEEDFFRHDLHVHI